MNDNNNTDKERDEREYKRVRGDFDVRVKIEDNDSFNIKRGKSIDVSGSGILLKYNKPLNIGKVISICFMRPNSFEFVECKARVVRSKLDPDTKLYEIAIEFFDIKEEDKKILDHFITYNE